MQILSTQQIRDWDQYTIAHEPISSLALMERAATACMEWLESNDYIHRSFHIFCGKGNNGGDGLALARLLWTRKANVEVSLLDLEGEGSKDFQFNLRLLGEQTNILVNKIGKETRLPTPGPGVLIIDALFGSGLNRPLDDEAARLVNHLNASNLEIISIDIPSGLFADKVPGPHSIIKARHTLSFQCYKISFLLPETEEYTGEIEILDIGLHPDFKATAQFEFVDLEMIRKIYKPRKRFSHKGNFGHALLVAGSYGKIGAAILASSSCLRTGAGLVTTHIPRCGYDIMQVAVPEAMVMTDFNSSICTKLEVDLSKFEVIGIGPGLGTASETKSMLGELLLNYTSPMVLDADALNILGQEKNLLKKLPPGSILTPHPKEFERMFGPSANSLERVKLALSKANELGSLIVLKGHHSFIACPSGKAYFNGSGNAGMATAGSGDVLTGILTGFLAQGYNTTYAALLGCYIHGLAGDIAAHSLSMEAMVATDIIHKLGYAFKMIYKN